MSILNVDKIQPIGGGSTITVDATDIQASTGTIRASTFSGDISATGIGVTSLNVAGVTTFASNVFLGDNDRILFGDGGMSDAHVRYDGNHLQFGVASGQFRVSADTASFVNYAGSQTLATINSTSVTIPTKLGINGASPQTPLDVIANSSSYAINVRGRSSDNVGEIRFTSNNYGSLYGQIVTGPTYLNFNTGGVERLQLDASEATFNSTGADTDFRIRTPAQGHMFFVDAGNDQVTIKTSSAQSGAVLTVNGRTHLEQLTLGNNSTLDAGAQATIYKPATNTLAFATAGANERLRITSNGELWVGTTSGISNSGYGGFSLNGSSGSILSLMHNGTEKLRLFGHTNPSIQYAGDLTFYSGVSGGTERARITHQGRIGLNGVVPTASHANVTSSIHLADSNTILSRTGNQYFALFQNLKYTSADAVRYLVNGYASAYVQDAGTHRFYTVGNGTQNTAATLSEKLRIDSNGHIITNGGVTELRGGKTYSTNSNSTWSTMLTFSSANNNGFALEIAVAENNYTTMYKVAGTAKWNTVYFTSDDAGDSNHSHSSDIEFRILNDSGTKKLQFKAVTYTTTRYLTVISVWCKSGYVNWS